MSKKSTTPSPQPVRFDRKEDAMIRTIHRRARGALSISGVVRRAVRFAGPKLLSGEIPLVEMQKDDSV